VKISLSACREKIEKSTPAQQNNIISEKRKMNDENCTPLWEFFHKTEINKQARTFFLKEKNHKIVDVWAKGLPTKLLQVLQGIQPFGADLFADDTCHIWQQDFLRATLGGDGSLDPPTSSGPRNAQPEYYTIAEDAFNNMEAIVENSSKRSFFVYPPHDNNQSSARTDGLSSPTGVVKKINEILRKDKSSNLNFWVCFSTPVPYADPTTIINTDHRTHVQLLREFVRHIVVAQGVELKEPSHDGIFEPCGAPFSPRMVCALLSNCNASWNPKPGFTRFSPTKGFDMVAARLGRPKIPSKTILRLDIRAAALTQGEKTTISASSIYQFLHRRFHPADIDDAASVTSSSAYWPLADGHLQRYGPMGPEWVRFDYRLPAPKAAELMKAIQTSDGETDVIPFVISDLEAHNPHQKCLREEDVMVVQFNRSFKAPTKDTRIIPLLLQELANCLEGTGASVRSAQAMSPFACMVRFNTSTMARDDNEWTEAQRLSHLLHDQGSMLLLSLRREMVRWSAYIPANKTRKSDFAKPPTAPVVEKTNEVQALVTNGVPFEELRWVVAAAGKFVEMASSKTDDERYRKYQVLYEDSRSAVALGGLTLSFSDGGWVRFTSKHSKEAQTKCLQPYVPEGAGTGPDDLLAAVLALGDELGSAEQAAALQQPMVAPEANVQAWLQEQGSAPMHQDMESRKRERTAEE
jgi:hypothetical protein